MSKCQKQNKFFFSVDIKSSVSSITLPHSENSMPIFQLMYSIQYPEIHSFCHLIHLYMLLRVLLKRWFWHFDIFFFLKFGKFVSLPMVLLCFVDDEMVGGFEMVWVWWVGRWARPILTFRRSTPTFGLPIVVICLIQVWTQVIFIYFHNLGFLMVFETILAPLQQVLKPAVCWIFNHPPCELDIHVHRAPKLWVKHDPTCNAMAVYNCSFLEFLRVCFDPLENCWKLCTL